jgi:hypothetical protein
MDATRPGSCPVVGLRISHFSPSGPTTSESLISYLLVYVLNDGLFTITVAARSKA